MIIIEGVDGSGKTTLCKEIASTLELQYVKIPRHKGDNELDGFKFYLQQAEQLPLDCVVDRFHLGEYVYPKLYADDRRKPLTTWQQHAIERVLLARGAVLLYVTARPDWIAGNRVKRNDGNWPSLFTELELFNEGTSRSLLFTKQWLADLNHDSTRLLDLLAPLERYERHRAEERSIYHATGHVNNHPIVLVGDQVNKTYRTKLAFAGWAGSSAYLHKALCLAGFKYPWYVTNVEDKSNALLVHEVSSLQALKVIALGQRAHERLGDALIPHVTFEHPAHHKRFHYHDSVYDYAWQLQRLVW